MDHQADKQEFPLMDDLRTRILKSVGQATATQWISSQQEKQMMPRLTRPSLPRLSAKELESLQKSDTGIFLPRRRQSVEVHGAENPSPKSSFGFSGSFTKIVATSQSVDGFLLLKIDRKKLGYLNSDSLRMFRWDEQLRRFELIRYSIVDSHREYVVARIALPGVYTIIGLHAHQAVLETIQIACQSKGVYQRLPVKSREAQKKRICGLVLCARKNGQLLDGLGDDICDDCLAIPTDRFFDLPECQIIEEVTCRDSDWECIRPFEIIGSEGRPHNRGIGC